MTLKAYGQTFGTIAVCFILGVSGCKRGPSEINVPVPSESAAKISTSGEPQRITVQHILISFDGSPIGKKLNRNKQQSEKLAFEIFEKAKGAKTNFENLVKQYTDDRAPGIYSMSNFGIEAKGEEFPRERMVGAFGDVGFKLKVGEVGLAPFDQEKSPYGFHIIKRLN